MKQKAITLIAMAQHVVLSGESVIWREYLIGLFKSTKCQRCPFTPTVKTLCWKKKRKKLSKCSGVFCVHNCGPSSALRSKPNQCLCTCVPEQPDAFLSDSCLMNALASHRFAKYAQ